MEFLTQTIFAFAVIGVTATPFCHKSDMLNCQCLI